MLGSRKVVRLETPNMIQNTSVLGFEETARLVARSIYLWTSSREKEHEMSQTSFTSLSDEMNQLPRGRENFKINDVA